MTTAESTTRYVDALEAASQAVLEEIKATSEEQARLAGRMYTEMEAAQRRALGVARRIAEHPADVAGNWAAVIDAQSQAQAQALDLTLAWLEGFTTLGEQRRARLEKLWNANREAMTAGVAASREAFTANPVAEFFRTGR